MESHSTQIDSPKPKKNFPVWVCWGAPGLLLVLVAVYFLLPPRISFPSPPVKLPSGNFAPQFRISRETTVITAPLDEEGYPDYEAAVNEKYGAGIDPKQNMVVGLIGAIGPKHQGKPIIPLFFQLLQMEPPAEKGDYLVSFEDFLNQDSSLTGEERWEISNSQLDPSFRQPWKSNTFPKVSQWLKANEKPLELVVRASRFPQYYFPLADPLKGLDPAQHPRMIPLNISYFSKIPDFLISRAYLRTGEGDIQGAREDLMTCRRIIQKVQPLSRMDFYLLLPLEYRVVYAERNMIPFLGLDQKQSVQWYREIEASQNPYSIANFCDRELRNEILQTACQFNRFGRTLYSNLEYFMDDKLSEQILKILDTDTLDWNDCLKELNRGMDRLVAILRIPHSLDRDRELKKWSQERKEVLDNQVLEVETGHYSNLGIQGKRKFMGKYLATVILHGEFYHSLVQSKLDQNEEQKRLFQIALELDLFQKEKGHYPESLQELTPTCLKEIPLDIYSDRPHLYQKTGNGYLLYSVGPNRIDDQGAERLFDNPPGDDICVRVPLPPIPLKSK